jgi:hypothetical protein
MHHADCRAQLHLHAFEASFPADPYFVLSVHCVEGRGIFGVTFAKRKGMNASDEESVLPMAFFKTIWFSFHMTPNVPHRDDPDGMGCALIHPLHAKL